MTDPVANEILERWGEAYKRLAASYKWMLTFAVLHILGAHYGAQIAELGGYIMAWLFAAWFGLEVAISLFWWSEARRWKRDRDRDTLGHDRTE